MKHFLFVFLHISRVSTFQELQSCRRYGRNSQRHPERPEAARRTPTHTHRSSQGMPCVSYTLGLDSLFHKLKAKTPKRPKPSGTPRVSGSNSPDPDVRTQCALDTQLWTHTHRSSQLTAVCQCAEGGAGGKAASNCCSCFSSQKY